MSGDLKARIAKWKKGQTAGISPSTVTLLNDCLTRIEKVEWEQENARLGLAAGNECREHTANENQLKADLEAAERLLPTIKHDEDGFVWLVIQNGLLNLCALSPITSMRFLEWAGKVDAYFDAKEKR